VIEAEQLLERGNLLVELPPIANLKSSGSGQSQITNYKSQIFSAMSRF
jgi:hypothetical protein